MSPFVASLTLAALVASHLAGSSPCSSCFPRSSYRSQSLCGRSPQLPIASPVVYHPPQSSTVFVVPNQLPLSIYSLPLSSPTICALSQKLPLSVGNDRVSSSKPILLHQNPGTKEDRALPFCYSLLDSSLCLKAPLE